MNYLYKQLDKYLPKNYFLQIIVLSLLILVCSIVFNISLFEILELELGENTTISELEKGNPYWYFFIVVIMAPLIETFFFQWIPIAIYKSFSHTKKYELLFTILAPLPFGLMHSYSLGYQISIYVMGFMYIIIGLYYSGKEKNYFAPIFFIHSFNNLIVYLTSFL